MRITILGAAGFVGSHLVEHLVKRSEHQVVGADLHRQKLAHLDPNAFTFHRADVRKDHDLVEILIRESDVVVDLVAFANPSRYVTSPIEVFELNFLYNLKIAEFMVPERYMAQVQLGLDVEVHVDAYPKEVFHGQVARINPTVDPQSRSFDVEAQIPNPGHRLKHGGFAKAEVIVGTADDAITVPLEAVTRFAGISKVFAVRDDTAQEVEIVIGTQGPGWVESLGGLQPGDVVSPAGNRDWRTGRASRYARVSTRQHGASDGRLG